MSNVERARINDKYWNWVEEKKSNVGLGKLGFARLKNLLILFSECAEEILFNYILQFV